MDIRTILFCLFLLNLFLGAFIYVVKKTQRHFGGIDFWIYSDILIALGYLLLSMRYESGNLTSVIFSHVFFVSAGFLRISGTRQFFNYNKNRSLLTLAFAVTVLVILLGWYFTFINNSELIRTLILGFTLSIISIYNGVLVFKNRPDKNSGAYTVTAISFFIFSLIFICRVILWFFEPSDRGLFNSAFINRLQFLASMIIDIIWSVMFFVMHNQRLNQQLTYREKELRDLNMGKDRFLSILAHDIKNVFNSLLNIYDLLDMKWEKISKEESHRYFTMLHNSTQKGYELFEDLLLWSASNLQKLVPDLENLILYDVVESVLEKNGSRNNAKNIQINNLISNPIQVKADMTMLQSVIRNLISNSIKYTHENGFITMKAKREGGEIIFSIQDNGVGISKSRINKLWTVSENISTPGTARETGTGLGLLLCRELTEKQGGRLWVESEEGQGSTFLFTLVAMD